MAARTKLRPRHTATARLPRLPASKVEPRVLVGLREALDHERDQRKRVVRALRKLERSLAAAAGAIGDYKRRCADGNLLKHVVVWSIARKGGMAVTNDDEQGRLFDLEYFLRATRARVVGFDFEEGRIDGVEALEIGYERDLELARLPPLERAAAGIYLEPARRTETERAAALGVERETLRKRRNRRRRR